MARQGRMGRCEECGFRVGSGGNRHKKGTCPPVGKRGDRGHSLHPARIMGRFDIGDSSTPGRGVSVAGIHGGGASSPTRGKSKQAVKGKS